MRSVPTLGYWDIRGLGQPIRFLLKYKRVKFNDQRYQLGQGSSLADIQQPWLPDKQSLGLDFPNLPYYIDGDLKLSQSLTILRYLGRKYGLMATDGPTLARQDMIEQQIHDMRKSWLIDVILSPECKERKSSYVTERLTPQLESLEKFLGSNEWLTSKLSYVDFLAYETLDWFRLFTPETIDKFPTLVQYLKRFENLKSIKAYMNSAHYKDWPLLGPFAHFGYNKE